MTWKLDFIAPSYDKSCKNSKDPVQNGFNSNYIKVTSDKIESRKCPSTMRNPGKHCKIMLFEDNKEQRDTFY